MNRSEFSGCRILLVEDEESLATGLEYNLTEEGYRVHIASDGREAVRCFQSESFDLVILDIMLPYKDGFEVADTIRAMNPRMPILMLTALSGLQDRIRGLESGADDYMTKPFHLEELLLRVKGMLRRKQWYQQSIEEQPIVFIGSYTINFEDFTVSSDNKNVTMTHREAMVLKYLVEHEGRIVSRNELLEQVWRISGEIETRTVDAFIARLRKIIEDDPRNPVFIQSIRSAGYRFARK
ncbi:MAG TPA: response regulator transcription factor, partial [bacterium]|nr:response regulator transcription factor [bacterium]